MTIRIGLGLVLVLAMGQLVTRAADDKGDVLFTRYFSITTPIFESNIPVKTCQALIARADQITMKAAQAGNQAGKILQSVGSAQLQIAGENLRSCATNDSLARQDRDLAVGLYAWMSVEQDRREHLQK